MVHRLFECIDGSICDQLVHVSGGMVEIPVRIGVRVRTHVTLLFVLERANEARRVADHTDTVALGVRKYLVRNRVHIHHSRIACLAANALVERCLLYTSDAADE